MDSPTKKQLEQYHYLVSQPPLRGSMRKPFPFRQNTRRAKLCGGGALFLFILGWFTRLFFLFSPLGLAAFYVAAAIDLAGAACLIAALVYL